MKTLLKQTLAALSALALAGGPAMAQTAQLTRIGGAGAVRGVVNAIAPNATVGRVVESGKPLYLNDHVTTKVDSRLQVMLLDETIFTVGPDSDMVLDEFVYDPNTSTGKVTARLTKGVFRFVTGKVARQGTDRMKINVPTGTIGIRGTQAVVEVASDHTAVILEAAGPNNTANQPAGNLRLDTKDGGVNLTRVGFGSDMRASGPPTTPSDRTNDLARIHNAIFPKPKANAAPPEGARGGKKVSAVQQTGGDAIAALGGLRNTNSFNQQANQNSQVTTQAQQDYAGNGGTDGLTNWDYVRSQLTTGTGTYQSPSVPYSCSGCGGSGGTWDFNMTIYFGQQKISGGSIQLNSQGSFTGDTGSLSSVSYANLSGAATVAPSISGTGTFTGTTISLLNAGGIAAKQAQLKLVYQEISAGTFNISGTAVGSR